MKRVLIRHIKKFFILIMFFAGFNSLIAQTITGKPDLGLRQGDLWYEQPYIWVGAACLFLFALVFLLKRNERNY